MSESSPIPEADPSLDNHVQAVLLYFWHGDEANGRPPSLSEWSPWPREDGWFLIRTPLQGVTGLGPNCIKNPRIAPLSWQEMAVHLRSGGKVNFPSWLAPMIAECFEKITNGKDCELSMGVKRTTGDGWTPLRDLWARVAIIETMRAHMQEPVVSAEPKRTVPALTVSPGASAVAIGGQQTEAPEVTDAPSDDPHGRKTKRPAQWPAEKTEGKGCARVTPPVPGNVPYSICY